MRISGIFFLSLLSTVVLSGLLLPSAESKPLKKPGERKFVIQHSRFVLVPSVTGGILVGDAADVAKTFDDNLGARFLYGGGLAAEVFLTHRFALGLHYGLTYKDIPNSTLNTMRGNSGGLYGLFLLAPEHRSSAYLKGEMGRIKAVIPEYFPPLNNYDVDLELGAFDYFQIGLGIATHTGSRSTLRTEIYYRTISSEGYRVPRDGRVIINTNYIGIEMAWGISLVRYR